MKKMFIAISVLFTAFILTSWVSPKEADSSTQSQTNVDFVVDFNGYSYGNSVTLIDDKGKIETVTSSQGLYHVLKLKPGVYTLVWDLVPYQETSCSVALSGTIDVLSIVQEMESHITITVIIGDGPGENMGVGFGVTCR